MGGMLGTAIDAGGQPNLRPQGDRVERSLRCVVTEENLPADEDRAKGTLALQHAINGTGNLGVARELEALGRTALFSHARMAQPPGCLPADDLITRQHRLPPKAYFTI